MTSFAHKSNKAAAPRLALRGLCVGVVAMTGLALAERAPLTGAPAEPSTHSSRFTHSTRGAVAVAPGLGLERAPWRNSAAAPLQNALGLFESRAVAGPLSGLTAAIHSTLMLALSAPMDGFGGIDNLGGGSEGDLETPLSVMESSAESSNSETTCSVTTASTEEWSKEAEETGSCGGPAPPQSAYDESESGGDPDMTKCSASGGTGTGGTPNSGGTKSETCSTIGVVPEPGGAGPSDEGSCSAHGEDNRTPDPPGDLFGDTKQANCSTSGSGSSWGGSSGGGSSSSTSEAKTCSIQPKPGKTGGGGCSAGSLQKGDSRDNPTCSVQSGSEKDSNCSVTGDSKGQTEVDCSAGNNVEGEKSTCSTFENGGEGSFCSVEAGPGGETQAACSAWDMSNPQGSGKSGDAYCSVIGDGAGTCSVQGSSGGKEHGNGGVDGFCTAGVGGGNTPGSGDAKCSVDPAGDGKGAGKCSAFKPDGTPHPKPAGQPKDRCFLPK